MIADYLKAKKLGEREYRRAVIRGRYPYLPSLEEMVREADRYPEISLGVAEIPLDMIAGTRTAGRQRSFAANFMPLMKEDSEFAAKWSSLYDAQVEEGIRDPVRVYEFMNRFYVEEGNKRVSVMRYVGAVSIPADVIRIMPPRTDSVQSRVYYEFLDFFKVTGLFEITFSAPHRYEELAGMLQQDLHAQWPEESVDRLHDGFMIFRNEFKNRGGRKLGITDGDAFLLYLGVYSLESLLEDGSEQISRNITKLWREFLSASGAEGVSMIESREEADSGVDDSPLARAAMLVEKTGSAGISGAAELAGAVAGIAAGAQAGQKAQEAVRTSLSAVLPPVPPPAEKWSPANPLRIAFLYEKDKGQSGWVYGHELGRTAIEESFGSLVQTMHFDNCRSQEEIEKAFQTVEGEGCGLVFAASPTLAQPALRFALEHPSVRVLNCRFREAKYAVRSYYGKMYEAKYLLGALAASLTDDHRIGYLASVRDAAAYSNINAFALGAQLIDPYCRIELQWVGDEVRRKEELSERLEGKKIHVISDIDMVRLKEEERLYGLYSKDDGGTVRRLAFPVWDWGVFYRIVVRRILNGTYDSIPADKRERPQSYWLGLSSGMVDVILAQNLPRPSYRLMEILRQGVAAGSILPFEGRMTAQDGTVYGGDGEALSNTEIMSMDWLVENVDGDLLRDFSHGACAQVTRTSPGSGQESKK